MHDSSNSKGEEVKLTSVSTFDDGGGVEEITIAEETGQEVIDVL